MERKDFYYDLPESFIAQHPLKDRKSSKLLVLDKETGEIEHREFKDIIDYLSKRDCLVLNDTRVMPARLYGHREAREESIEILLLKNKEDTIWEVMVRPGKKARPGHRIIFSDRLSCDILEITEDGTRYAKFNYEGILEEILDELGEMPLPPYIREKLEDQNRYQTVYSKHVGSAAAPTAGLHFTEDLLEAIRAKGVEIAYVTLHVGLGTFRPVKVDNILDHHMHSEFYVIDQEAADKINKTKAQGGRVVSVGTTSTRTLESVADENAYIRPGSGWTDIFIYPGYEFKIVDRLITNFHLPESTLLMLVSALASRDIIMNAYEEAKEKNYRFFSFGDAMFIK